MKLSKTSTHATLAVVYLAQCEPGVPIQARQIAKHLGIPTDSALKILQALVRQRVIQSQLGRTGGYYLTREPENLTLLELVEAIDGPICADINLPVNHVPGEGPAVLLQQACDRAVALVRGEFARYSIATLSKLDSVKWRAAG